MTRGVGQNTEPDTVEDILGERLSEGLIIIGLSVIAFYLWSTFVSTDLDLSISISLTSLLAASIMTIAAIVVKFLKPKKRSFTYAMLFLLLSATSTLLILTGDSSTPPFLVLTSIAAIFAPLFGQLPLTIVIIFIATQLIFGLTSGLESLASSLLIFFTYSLIPLGIGLIIGRRQLTDSGQDPMAELSRRLSTTKGKSDIVINTIEDGVLTIDGKGMIDLINPSAQNLIGWTQGDALGLDWQSVLKLVNSEGRDISDLENPIFQSLSTNKQIHNDSLFLLTSSEKKRIVSIVSTPVGSVGSGTIVVLRDITKEKADEREQAEFISTASHEMRTPVASIEGYLGLVLNPNIASIDEKARDFITKAHESAQHLGRLFQDLLDISKSEDGRLKNDPAIVDIIAATNNVFESLAPLATKKQLRYIFKQAPGLEIESTARRLDPVYYADIDPDHFREVVSNLIENAIKYTSSGDIIVDVKGDDKIVTISVTDSGIGIPVEDIPHLFQKFYRVDNTETREIGGTGLGLYLCRRLAEAMGGGLRVKSHFKKGSTFYLDVPRTSHEDAMIKLNQIGEPITEILHEDRDRVEHEPTTVPEHDLLAPKEPAISNTPVEQTLHQPTESGNYSPIAQPTAIYAAPTPANYTPLPPQQPSPQPTVAAPALTLDQIEQQFMIQKANNQQNPQTAAQQPVVNHAPVHPLPPQPVTAYQPAQPVQLNQPQPAPNRLDPPVAPRAQTTTGMPTRPQS